MLSLILAGCGSGNGGGPYAPPASTSPTGNQAPSLASSGPRTVSEGQLLNFVVSATDPEAGDRITLQASALPSGATFVDHSDGTGTFNWTPPIGAAAGSPYSVTFTATDTAGSTASQTVVINVVAAGTSRGSATRTDFNGDGYSDLAVGVPGEDIEGVSDAGAVHVFYGSAGQLPAGDELWHQNISGLSTSAAPNDRFGSAVATGDFNADGYTDLAVGIPNKNGTAGQVLVLYGSSNGLRHTGHQVWSQGVLLDTAETDDRFGSALTSGDFNGDGYADLAIGVPGEDFADVGNPSVQPVTPVCDNGVCTNAGIVNLVYGSASGLSAAGNQLWHQDRGDSYDGWVEWQDCFGSSLAAADFDGNGVDDLAVGTPCEHTGGGDVPGRNLGAVSVYYSTAGVGPTGAGAQYLRQWHTGVEGFGQDGDALGYALAAGDFNGDGFADLAIGVPGEETDNSGGVDSGAVAVFYGQAGDGLSANELWHKNSPNVLDQADAGDRFGAALAAGDFNNDGYTDVAIGAPRDTVDGKASAGSVSILYGGPVRLSANGNQYFTQDSPDVEDAAEASDQFGYTLMVGDFNGDGIDDVLVGAPFETGNGIDAGAVHILQGVQGTGISATNSRLLSQGSSGAKDTGESGDQFGGRLLPRLYNNALP